MFRTIRLAIFAILGLLAPLAGEARARNVCFSDVNRSCSTDAQCGGSACIEVDSCTQSDEAACLYEGRFKVSIRFGDRNDNKTYQQAKRLQSSALDNSAIFYFYEVTNWEFLVKILPCGPGLRDYFWFYGGGSTDLAYDVRVIDTKTGLMNEYHNDSETPAVAITDSEAFPCRLPPLQCRRNGETCSASNPCCSGEACSNGRCQVSKCQCRRRPCADVCYEDPYSCSPRPWECGKSGQSCCRNQQCGGGLSCQSGVCQPPRCGGSGQSCCSNQQCGGGLSCQSGVCQPPRCGGNGQFCCSDGQCNSGLSCQSGVCRIPSCGGNGEFCCSNQQCNSGLSCQSGVCRSGCGGNGQFCCFGEVCDLGLSCDFELGVCRVPSCLGNGAPCSLGGTACCAGTSCSFDNSEIRRCTNRRCGNGVWDEGEECDSTDNTSSRRQCPGFIAQFCSSQCQCEFIQ